MTNSSPARNGKLDKSTILAMVAMSLVVFVIANDFVAMSVALPRMEEDLNTDVSVLQWVINAYAVVFGVLLILQGIGFWLSTGFEMARFTAAIPAFFAKAGVTGVEESAAQRNLAGTGKGGEGEEGARPPC